MSPEFKGRAPADDTSSVGETRRTGDAPLARVLVLDEDDLVGAFLVELLGSAGFETEALSSAPKALLRLAERPPDVVVFEAPADEQAGLEMARQIRARAPLSRLVVVSACGSAPTTLAYLHAGAVDVVFRTVDRASSLVDRVRLAAQRAPGGRPPLERLAAVSIPPPPAGIRNGIEAIRRALDAT